MEEVIKNMDIFDINYQYGSEKLNFISYIEHSSLPRGGILIRVASFFFHLFKNIFKYMKEKTHSLSFVPHNAVLFFITTKNQKDSLCPVQKKVLPSRLAGNYIPPIGIEFPLCLAYLTALPFLPFLIFSYFKASNYQKKTFQYALDEYWLIYGYYIVAKNWLSKYRPKAVVLANDHNYPNRSVLKASIALKIPSIYIQHASVNNKFPPLLFNYALLDGLDALEKYSEAGNSETRVFLIGTPKADAHLPFINKKDVVHRIGICTNNIDSLMYTQELLDYLHATFPKISFILSQNATADSRRIPDWKDLAANCKMDFSDSIEVLSFNFLNSVDAIIVSDSNIALEAAIMNVYPLYYDVNKTKLDHYGFYQNGLVEYFSEPKEIGCKIEELLIHKPYVRNRAKRYCHTIDTVWDGRSSDLAAILIEKISKNDKTLMNNWGKISGTSLEAYEPLSED